MTTIGSFDSLQRRVERLESRLDTETPSLRAEVERLTKERDSWIEKSDRHESERDAFQSMADSVRHALSLRAERLAEMTADRDAMAAHANDCRNGMTMIARSVGVVPEQGTDEKWPAFWMRAAQAGDALKADRDRLAARVAELEADRTALIARLVGIGAAFNDLVPVGDDVTAGDWHRYAERLAEAAKTMAARPVLTAERLADALVKSAPDAAESFDSLAWASGRLGAVERAESAKDCAASSAEPADEPRERGMYLAGDGSATSGLDEGARARRRIDEVIAEAKRREGPIGVGGLLRGFEIAEENVTNGMAHEWRTAREKLNGEIAKIDPALVPGSAAPPAGEGKPVGAMTVGEALAAQHVGAHVDQWVEMVERDEDESGKFEQWVQFRIHRAGDVLLTRYWTGDRWSRADRTTALSAGRLGLRCRLVALADYADPQSRGPL